ncbi:helix-turn-helix domain-containing protein [Vibrio sp. TH_r3]|uniref:winged helix-turn-helix domain-containing protein n=1 Tax=Vibrio sp. TH_r3 TaxID=3082084 RepID=UPI002953F159|nr:helix-turn-helix domain-containing protein [Vibrio sp. TH_r3]MDV7105982.1 helix-turn-helix domain-containing protein [Vibrio sp. TH_r3]
MKNKCLFDNCIECIENNNKNNNISSIELKETVSLSNFHHRLLCILSSQSSGAIFSVEDIKEFVWPRSIVGDSSVPQLIHHVRKLLPEGYDIVCIRNRGYLLISPNNTIFNA